VVWNDKPNEPRKRQKTNSEFARPLNHYSTLTEGQILQSVASGSLFGAVECDIRVPELLKEKFAEMCPIFKNCEITRDDIGDYMQDFVEENDIMSRPRRVLNILVV